MRPKNSNCVQPLFELYSEPPSPCILDRSQLLYQSERAEDGNAFFLLRQMAAVRQPHEQIQHRRRAGQNLDRFQICGYWVRGDFSVEFIAEHDHVLEIACQYRLVWIMAAPDPGLSQEVEPRPLHHLGGPSHLVGTEKDSGPEDPLKGLHGTAIFLAAFAHPERIEHFGPGAKANRLAVLPNGQGRQIDWNQAIPAVRQPEFRTPGDLQDEAPVPALE